MIQITKVTIDVEEDWLQTFTNDSSIRFRLIQLEHRGGFCDCWSVADLKVIHWADQDLRYNASHTHTHTNMHGLHFVCIRVDAGHDRGDLYYRVTYT